jgi:hypothetical protein
MIRFIVLYPSNSASTERVRLPARNAVPVIVKIDRVRRWLVPLRCAILTYAVGALRVNS